MKEEEEMDEEESPMSIVTVGRVCNMLAEIAKRQGDVEGAIRYYLKGLEEDPLGFIDNFFDFADLCLTLKQPEIHNLLTSFAKLITQINDGNVSMADANIEEEPSES